MENAGIEPSKTGIYIDAEELKKLQSDKETLLNLLETLAKYYLADLNNIVGKSPAQENRIRLINNTLTKATNP